MSSSRDEFVVRSRLKLKTTTKTKHQSTPPPTTTKETTKETTKPSDAKRTKAEIAHDVYVKTHEKRLLLTHASASHRDKVARFNDKLSKLSEHHDIPKVGPG